MAEMQRDDSGADVTIDESEPKGYSVIGPLDDGQYAAWDHKEGAELGQGSREAMNDLAGERAAEMEQEAEAGREAERDEGDRLQDWIEAGDDEPEIG